MRGTPAVMLIQLDLSSQRRGQDEPILVSPADVCSDTLDSVDPKRKSEKLPSPVALSHSVPGALGDTVLIATDGSEI